MMNSRMPKGRTMVKWQAFASLPEQFHGINQIIQEQSKVAKPVLDEQQIEEIGRILTKAIHTKQEVILWYYRNGYIHHEIMDIQKIDLHQKKIITTDAFRFQNKFYLDDIVDCKFNN
ncbi:YolD-like family protein [Bacillus cereus]|uniref:YolD-like family protein n=1 Tax=Bacillus cereus TaxID=1396 RepID=UPI00187A45D4|nr:YolD-like family protein [Bacillus cereus]MBE7106095.1 YolD-like family protein [Bacillus cereus]